MQEQSEPLVLEGTLPSPYDKPTDFDELSSAEQTVSTLMSAEYWRKVCPNLHVDDEAFRRRVQTPEATLDSRSESQLKRDMCADGYFTLSSVSWSVSVREIAIGIIRLIQYGWSPTWIFIYDEVWMMAQQVRELLKRATGGNEMSMDFFAWYVDPSRSGKGWGPHRDRMGSDATSFREDKTPKLNTTWVALTDAWPENSCLYVIPASADPKYWIGDEKTENIMNVIFSSRPESFQHIRAVPLKAGSFVSFSHRLIHWGSATRKSTSLEPRIALSFVSATDDFEPPYFARTNLPYPSVRLRVSLIAAQCIAYRNQEAVPSARGHLFFRLFQTNWESFHPAYVRKVEWLWYMRPPPKKTDKPKKDEPEKEGAQADDASSASPSKPSAANGKKEDAAASSSTSTTTASKAKKNTSTAARARPALSPEQAAAAAAKAAARRQRREEQTQHDASSTASAASDGEDASRSEGMQFFKSLTIKKKNKDQGKDKDTSVPSTDAVSAPAPAPPLSGASTVTLVQTTTTTTTVATSARTSSEGESASQTRMNTHSNRNLVVIVDDTATVTATTTESEYFV